MNESHFSRRRFLKGALAAAGAAAGTRLAGRVWLPEAAAANETSHVVHIMFPGGYNALFAGCADKYIAKGTFGVSNANVAKLAGGVFTDKDTLGTMPQFALDHWAAVGCRHGNTAHLSNGAEKALLFDGKNSYLNQLAVAMGGSSTLKSVHFGERMPYEPQPAFQGVSLQRIQDLKSAIGLLGKQGVPDPTEPDRDLEAGGLDAAGKMTAHHANSNAAALTSLTDGYGAAVETLRKPVPPTPPVTFDDISKAYGLNGATGISRFPSMLAGAEVMIRAFGSNVVSINEPDLGVLVHWDFHQTSGGASLNGVYSRNKMKDRIIGPLKTFLDRMLNLPDKNVVVMLDGDFVRTPTGDHGDGTVVTLFGKYVKNTVSYPCDGSSRFAPGTPGTKQLWAAVASAAKIQSPFGASPHKITL